MALHPNLPESPYAILDPVIRWFPAEEALRATTMDARGARQPGDPLEVVLVGGMVSEADEFRAALVRDVQVVMLSAPRM